MDVRTIGIMSTIADEYANISLMAGAESPKKPLVWTITGSIMKLNKNKSGSTRKASAESYTGGGNVFADLGLSDADERLAKAELAHEICSLIAGAKLSQTKAAERLGVDQPKISALMRGRLKDFSTERLLRFITALDRDVVISIRNPQNERHPRVRVAG